jgi:hypothetical protein
MGGYETPEYATSRQDSMTCLGSLPKSIARSIESCLFQESTPSNADIACFDQTGIQMKESHNDELNLLCSLRLIAAR